MSRCGKPPTCVAVRLRCCWHSAITSVGQPGGAQSKVAAPPNPTLKTSAEANFFFQPTFWLTVRFVHCLNLPRSLCRSLKIERREKGCQWSKHFERTWRNAGPRNSACPWMPLIFRGCANPVWMRLLQVKDSTLVAKSYFYILPTSESKENV